MFGRRIYSGTVLTLGMIQLIESLAFSLPMSFFPNYAIGLGATVASIGIFTSSFSLASAIMSPRMGSLSDRRGRKMIIVWGLVADIIVGALTGLAPSWIWLLLIRVLNGAVSSAAMLSAEALLMESVPASNWGEASGFVMSMGMIGRNLGPAFGGIIQSISYSSGLSLVDSYRIPYFVDAATAVLALVLVIWRVKEPETRRLESAGPRRMAHSSDVKVPMTFSFKVLLACSFVSGMGMGFIMPIMVLFYNDKFGIEPAEIGLIFSISGFIGLFASYLAGRYSDRAGRKPVIGAGNYLSNACNFILPLTADTGQAAGVLSLRSLAFNISMPAMRALRADITPPEARGRYFGLFATAHTAGDIVSPIIGAYIYDLYRYDVFNVAGFALPGYSISFFINSLLGVVSTTMLLVLVKETPKELRASRKEPVEKIE